MSHALSAAALTAVTPPPLLGVVTSSHGRYLLSAITEHGEQHYDDGEPLQDAHRLVTIGPHIVMAVADGVSTASHSVDGANAAVRAVVASLEADLATGPPDEPMVRRAMGAAHTAIQDVAAQRGCPSHDFATTLAFAVLTDDHVAAASIGDSSILTFAIAGKPATPALAPFLSPPQSPSGRIFSISEPGWERRFSTRVEHYPRLRALILNTDGADNLFTTTSQLEGYNGFTAERLADLPHVIDAFGPRRMSIFWHGFLSETEACNHDDRTVLMAYRMDSPRPAKGGS